MTNLGELRDVAKNLRTVAVQIRRDNEAKSYPTAGTDAALLEKAAKIMEDAAGEIEQLKSPK